MDAPSPCSTSGRGRNKQTRPGPHMHGTGLTEVKLETRVFNQSTPDMWPLQGPSAFTSDSLDWMDNGAGGASDGKLEVW